MKEPKDKRTKAYKEWKASQPSEEQLEDAADNITKGLGDMVASVTDVLGIKKVVETLTPEGKDCGCNKRQGDFNAFGEDVKRVLGIKNKPLRCFTDEQFNQYANFVNTRKKNTWDGNDRKMLVDLYAHVFAISYAKYTWCNSCQSSSNKLKSLTSDLDAVYYKVKSDYDKE